MRAQQADPAEADADDALALYFGNTRNGIRAYSGVSGFFDVDPPGYNVIQACTDTKVAHLVKNQVRPFFLTERGDFEAREKAEGMQCAVEATFVDLGIWGADGTDVCFDGNLFRGGFMLITPDFANMRVSGERVFPWELFVPEREALRGKPRQLAYIPRGGVERNVLLDLFKDADEEVIQAIRDASPAPRDTDTTWDADDQVADMVPIAQLWHLPSGRIDRSDPSVFTFEDERGKYSDPGHDGRMIIMIEGHTLLDRPWPYPYFPFAEFKPMKKPTGFWSRSIPETLAGTQLALNRMDTRIDGIMHLHARPLLLVWNRAKINTDKITNSWCTIIGTEQPPGQSVLYLTPQSVPSEYLRRRQELIGDAEKQVGLSELSIAAQKPAGIEHAPALEHLADTESIRHTPAFRAWEAFHIQASRLVIDSLRLLAEYADENDKDFDIVWGDDQDMKRIDFRQVDLEDSRFKIKVWPTNLLPKTPAALTQRLITYLQMGIFTVDEVKRALEFPDVKALFGDDTAEERNIQRRISTLLKTGDPSKAVAHGYLNLAMAKVITAKKINALEADGVDDKRIDLVRQFYEDVVALINKQTNEQVQASQGVLPPGGPGGGMPAAPPGANGAAGPPMGVAA